MRSFIRAAYALSFALPLMAQSLRPVELRCEYRSNPLGIDAAEPRLSWIDEALDPHARGLRQSAWRVIAATSEENLRAMTGDLWDSGKVDSAQSIHVVYHGKRLASGQPVFWRVQVWDQDGKPSAWSEPARWSMGLLDAADWKAKWIGYDEQKPLRDPASPYQNLVRAEWIWSNSDDDRPRFFRTRFEAPANRQIVRATIIAGADANLDAFLNGERLGTGGYRMPAVFDVSGQLRSGENVLAIRATRGRGRPPGGLIGAIRIDFAGGVPLVIGSGAAWRVSDSNTEGWQKFGFDDASWLQARVLGAYGMEPWGDVGFSEERWLPARMLRKEFRTASAVKRAVAHVSGLGLYELYLNGRKAGDHVLSPGLTDYDKRVLYVTYDVTSQIGAGQNAIGVMLGNGRYWAPRGGDPIGTRSFGYPKARVQLEIEYANGARETIASDETWRLTTQGPVIGNNEYDGETYDARLEMPGWSRAGFDDSKWMPASVVAAPAGVMSAQMAEPLRVVETIKPVSVNRLRSGVYIFDMGQNMVGWCRLKVSGAKGTQVSLRHAETLREDGGLYVDNLRSARAADFYTLKGQGTEVWEPRFTYHGFRYVEVQGYPGEPPLGALEGRVVHDDMPRIAGFTTSSELLNRIHENIYWGIRGNYRSIPTDCPQRDERQGWLGDRSMVSRSESYLFDVAAFYGKWSADLADSQRPNGSIPDVVPNYWTLYNNDVTWPSTLIFVPNMLYEQYADRRVLERTYPAMKRWIEFMRGFMKDDLMPKDTYGDWCVPPESPKLIHSQDPARRTEGPFIGSAYFYHLLGLVARDARLVGKPDDAAEYEALAARMKAAFHKKYFNADSGLYSNGTQTSSILPLAFRLAPGEARARLFDGLISRIERESNGHVGTGLIGAQWLMRTLTEGGRPDVAYQIATQRTYPGWGYMIEKGATTIWELWNGDTADPAMNSGNHVMQIGDLAVWMYADLAGIRADPDQPGFAHTVIRPYLAGDLRFVKASHQSMYGAIATHWRREGAAVVLDVTIPANTTATIHVPAAGAASVTESGKPARDAAGVKFLRMEQGAAVFEVGSGSYSFRS